MSRGLGAVQRAVLALLERPHPPVPYACWPTVAELATEMFDGRPARAQVESVRRRAVKSLARTGRVELILLDAPTSVRAARVDRGDGYAYRPRHESHRPMLAAHGALSVEEKTAIGQLEARWRTFLAGVAT